MPHYQNALDLAIAHLKPADVAHVRGMLPHMVDIPDALIAQYVLAPSAPLRDHIAAVLLGQGLDPLLATHTLRELIAFEARVGPRTRLIAQHIADANDPATPLPAVSSRMARAVRESPAVAHLARTDPALFAQIETSYFRKDPARSQAGADVERSFMASLRQRGAECKGHVDRPDRAAPRYYRARPGGGSGERAIARPDSFGSDRSASTPNNHFDGCIPILGSDNPQPGARIDHEVLGRGTILSVNGDQAEILFDGRGGGNHRWSSQNEAWETTHSSFTERIDLRKLGNLRRPQRPDRRARPRRPVPFAGRAADRTGPARPLPQRRTPARLRLRRADRHCLAGAGGRHRGIRHQLDAGRAHGDALGPERAELQALITRMGGDIKDPQFVHHAELASLFQLRAELRRRGQHQCPKWSSCSSIGRPARAAATTFMLVAQYLGIPELRALHAHPERRFDPDDRKGTQLM